MNVWEIIAVFLSGLILSVIMVPLTRTFSARTGCGLDQPDHFRKGHRNTTSRLGGIPIVVAWMITVGWMLVVLDVAHVAQVAKVIACSLLMFGLGLVDDLHPLGAKVKLVAQLSIACLAWLIGLRIELLWYLDIGPLSFPLTIGWLVLIPNIVNLVDGMDGLSGGITFTLCVTLAILSAMTQQYTIALSSVAAAGAVLGFLIFNLPPARIFMGDAGAYFLGFLIAGSSVASENKAGIAAAMLVVGIALGVPILDTAFAVIRRGLRGVSIFRGDKEHIHHKLRILGFSNESALFIIYGASAFLALIALTVFWTNGAMLPVAVSALALLGVMGARFLGYVGRWSDFRDQVTRAWNRRRDVQYANLLGGVLEMEIERQEDDDSACFWGRMEDSLQRVGFRTSNGISGTGDNLSKLKVHLRGHDYWVLHYEAGTRRRGSECWMRIAEAFLPALALGLRKWPAATRPSWLALQSEEPEAQPEPAELNGREALNQ